MGMASATMDLRLLKKLALNSINYTTLDQNAKGRCMDMFITKWNATVKLEYIEATSEPEIVII